MSDIFRVPYLVVGAGVQIAEQFYTERKAEGDVQLAYIREYFGASSVMGYSHRSGIRSLLFDADVESSETLAVKYKVLGRQYKPTRYNFGTNEWYELTLQEQRKHLWIEARPRKDNRVNRALDELYKRIPSVRSENNLVQLFDWIGEAVFDENDQDNTLWYYGTAQRFVVPTVRYVLTLPRTADDGYTVPDSLHELKLSEHMAIFAEHNTLAKANRDRAAA